MYCFYYRTISQFFFDVQELAINSAIPDWYFFRSKETAAIIIEVKQNAFYAGFFPSRSLIACRRANSALRKRADEE